MSSTPFSELRADIDADPVRLERVSRERLEAERDLLGDALGRLLVALGGVDDVPMTGPQLLLAAEDAISHFSPPEPTVQTDTAHEHVVRCSGCGAKVVCPVEGGRMDITPMTGWEGPPWRCPACSIRS